MVWKERITQATVAPGMPPKFFSGLNQGGVAELTKRLGFSPHADLLALLRESDGVQTVQDVDGKAVNTGWLLWSAKLIISETADLKKKLKRAAGEGQFVCFAPGDDVTFVCDEHGKVHAWYDLDGELVGVADSLAEFVVGWTSGELTV